MKMLKLVQNEIIKILKKTSTKVMFILLLVAILGAFGFSKLIMMLNNSVMSVFLEESDWQANTKSEIEYLKQEIKDNNYDNQTLAYINAEIETYELALECNIAYPNHYYQYWKTEVLDEILQDKQELKLNELLENAEANEFKEKINQKVEILKSDDYSRYIELEKSELKKQLEDKQITQEKYENEIYLLDLQDKYKIFAENSNEGQWKIEIYQDIELIRNNLNSRFNSISGKMLKLEEIEELEDNLKIDLYRLENGIPASQIGSTGRATYDTYAPMFCLLILAIFMIIIMGSAISTEVSKGTIKFLLFTPNKRWKILLSKLLAGVIILIVTSLCLSVISFLLGNIFFKEEGLRYLYVQGGEVKELSNLEYTSLYFLISCIDIFIYMLFALMLSTLTRNTSLAVGISIASYVGSGIVMQIMNSLIKADWLKFIPFNNFSIVDRVFINNYSYSVAQYSMQGGLDISVGFSLAVLGVCAILMLITTFDSFNKRDIV